MDHERVVLHGGRNAALDPFSPVEVSVFNLSLHNTLTHPEPI